MNIAIIPARGGSKRIPRKNIKTFANKPMIAHAIGVAQNSGLFDQIVVSTDDDEITEIAIDYGANVPFKRDVKLSDDLTPTVPVISNAIHECQLLGWNVDYVCCIYPAVPFLQSDDLINALEILEKKETGYVFPVTTFPSAIQRALRKLPTGKLEPFYSQYVTTRTQDLEPAFYDVGQFYWGHSSTWLDGMILHNDATGLVIPDWRVVDIDTLDDWHRAELMYSAFSNQN